MSFLSASWPVTVQPCHPAGANLAAAATWRDRYRNSRARCALLPDFYGEALQLNDGVKKILEPRQAVGRYSGWLDSCDQDRAINLTASFSMRFVTKV